MNRRFFAAIRFASISVLILLIPLGCANTPPGAGSTSGPQLIVTMTVAGTINPQYFYFVLFNNANDTTGSNGPIPVIAAPWGNGFAAGRTANAGLTQYVEYAASQPQGFGVYGIVPGSNLRSSTYLGIPVQSSATNNTLQFQIPLAQLATAAVPLSKINSVQINFLATNTVPIDPNYTGTKYFDALGNSTDIGSINSYITISTLQNGIYQNSDHNLEPSGDVAEAGNGVYRPVNEPDLDIVNWSVEVRG